MNEQNNIDPVDEWLEARRNETTPDLPADFSEQIAQRIAVSKAVVAASPRIWMMRIAALFVVGAVGFLRMELFTRITMFFS